MAHEDEVAFIMGEIAERARNPLPLARDLRRDILEDLASGDGVGDLSLPAPAGRLARLRQVVVDVVSDVVLRQNQINRIVLRSLRQLEALSTVLEERYKRGWANVDQRLGTIQRTVDELRERQAREEALGGVVAAMQMTMADLMIQIETLTDEVGRIDGEAVRQREHLATYRSRADLLADLARRLLAEPPTPELQQEIIAANDRSFDDLYSSFEDAFRGSREDIQKLQRPYLDIVHAAGLDDLPVLDVGPGRCEWLELLRSEGVDAYGIDVNKQMVAVGEDLGVDVRAGDALHHLAELDEGSLRAITAFHFIEHISLEAQISFLRLSARALAPGGVLLLETPNPTNLVVGASSFYLDPTHLRPMHPLLLEFLVAAQGLVDVKVDYLHPNEGFSSATDPTGEFEDAVRWALFGPQDYVVIAKKPRPSTP